MPHEVDRRTKNMRQGNKDNPRCSIRCSRLAPTNVNQAPYPDGIRNANNEDDQDFTEAEHAIHPCALTLLY